MIWICYLLNSVVAGFLVDCGLWCLWCWLLLICCLVCCFVLSVCCLVCCRYFGLVIRVGCDCCGFSLLAGLLFSGEFC